MSIKPVDFQVMLPKTSEVSKIRSDEQQKSQASAQQTASTTQHKVEDNMRQVHSQDSAQKAGIREKQTKDKDGKKDEKKKGKGNYSIDKKRTGEEKTSTIDIKI